MKILDETCKFKDGKYETGLLWKNGSQGAALQMPKSASETMARSQTLKLKAHLSQKPEQLEGVETQMQNLLDKVFAVEVPSEEF